MKKQVASTQKSPATKKATPSPMKKGIKDVVEEEPDVSSGSIYLELINARPDWVHRRVETISFLADDSTKRRVSYDFTLPSWAYPIAVGDRIGVPITNMRKELLKSLSVTDASNRALSVWDTDQNGLVGVDVLDSLITGFVNRGLTEDEREMVKTIVLSKLGDDVTWEVDILCSRMRNEGSGSEDALFAAESIIQEFVENFVFIVEVPLDYLDIRHIIKVSYDQEIGGARAPNLKKTPTNKFLKKCWTALKRFIHSIMEYGSPTGEFSVESSSFSSSASEHLEIHAPDDLQVTSLTRHTIDEYGQRNEATSTSTTLGHIAHIKFKNNSFEGLDSTSIVEFAPVISGLLLQTYLGTLLGVVLLGLELHGVNKLFAIIPKPGDAGPFAAISLALPAFLLTLLARSREHNHVKEVLRTPRAVALLSTVILFIAAATLVLEPSDHLYLSILRVLAFAQVAAFVVVSVALDTVIKVNRQK